MDSGLIMLLLFGLAILFVLTLGVGLLVYVLKRGKSAASPSLPGQHQAGALQKGPAFPPPPAPSPDYAAVPRSPVPVHQPPPAQPHQPPVTAPAPGTGVRTDALDPALFETQRSHERPTGPTPGNRDTTEQPSFQTAASANPVDDYAPADLFATTPSVPHEEPAAGPAPMAPFDGPDGYVAIGATGIKIGRHPECDVVVPTPGASRQHAAVRFENGDWILEDLNSGNGTFVNGVRVRSHHLVAGDEVRVDQTVMTFGLGSR
jgi:hypothetical protein